MILVEWVNPLKHEVEAGFKVEIRIVDRHHLWGNLQWYVIGRQIQVNKQQFEVDSCPNGAHLSMKQGVG